MVWYNTGKSIFMDPRFDWGTAMPEPPFEILLDKIFVALMQDATGSNTYSINIDTDLDFGDIAISEIDSTGYTARGDGVFLGSKAVAVDNTNDRAEFDAADHVYTAIGPGTSNTFDQIVIGRENDSGPANGTSPLIAHATVNATTTNGGDITLVWNAEGILQITA
jgi:hypothetical protein